MRRFLAACALVLGAGCAQGTTASDAAEDDAVCTPGTSRCRPEIHHQSRETCVGGGDVSVWADDDCPTDYTCHYFSTCRDGRCMEDPWPTESGVDNDDDGYPDRPPCGGPYDCNDSNPTVHPGADEACNGVDDDCDGTTDEGC